MARRRHQTPASKYSDLILIIDTQVEDEVLRGRLRVAADELNAAWFRAVRDDAVRTERMLGAR